MEAVLAMIPVSVLGSVLGYLCSRFVEHRLAPHTTLNVETRREVAKLRVVTLKQLSMELHAYASMDPDEHVSEEYNEAWQGIESTARGLRVLLPKARYQELDSFIQRLGRGYIDAPEWSDTAERLHDFVRTLLLDY